MKWLFGATDARVRLARVGGMAVSALVLASCGGGGGDAGGSGSSGTGTGGGGHTTSANTLVASSTVAGHCAAPRSASILDENGAPYGDVQGSVLDEKTWVRSWIDETYLWYKDVQALSAATLNAGKYATAVDYFDALKSPLTTASGKPKDQFHFIYDTPTWVALSQSGTSYGYGFEIALIATSPPRQAVIAYTHPGTPAATNGIARGAEVVAVDGVDLVNDNTDAGIAKLNAGLFPDKAGLHNITVRDLGATTTRVVAMTAAALSPSTVENVKTLPAPNQNVGYMQFNDHLATSEGQLVAAINQLKTSGVTDLVLDIRYNGGGYLDVAAELAYMIAGSAPTANKVFEQQVFNDKNPFQLTAAQTVTPFHATTLGWPNGAAAGQALPTLNLSRVYLLVGAGTCSASEAVANGLRGVGVQVNLIGATTCGKPYGFYPQDNCGTTYFSIQFQGVNQLGQGDYADGFAPTCSARDDFNHALGDPAEARLASALSYRANGVCDSSFARAQSASSSTASTASTEPALVRTPLRENRIYRR
jgi:carboxyl-terminal processing protease